MFTLSDKLFKNTFFNSFDCPLTLPGLEDIKDYKFKKGRCACVVDVLIKS